MTAQERLTETVIIGQEKSLKRTRKRANRQYETIRTYIKKEEDMALHARKPVMFACGLLALSCNE